MTWRPFKPGDSNREQAEREIDDELAFHFEQATRDLQAGGLSADAARAAANRRFGPVRPHRARLLQMQLRRITGGKRRAAMQLLMMSVRSVVRDVTRAPGFTLGVIAILTLGLGVNAITFSLVDRLVLRGPAAVAEPQDLRRVVVHRHNRSGVSVAVTDLAYLDYRDLLASRQLAGAAAESSTPLLFGSGEGAERIQARLVTANYFSLLGTSPAAGRFFTEDESERQGLKLVVLSHAFWQRRFGGDPAVLGQVLPIESGRYTVVGVAARQFTGSSVTKVDVFLPLEAASEEQIAGPWRTSRNLSWIGAIVRLAPGISASAAEPELTAMHRQGRATTPNSDPNARVALEPLNAVRGASASGEIGVAALVWAIALLVLAIAAANVANLFLARALRRSDQLAVRLALGAGRGRLVLEEACEGALLALVGATVAVLVAVAGAPVVQMLLFPQIDWLDTSVDLRGLLFVAACAVVAGSVAAALPMWRAAKMDVLSWLRTGQRSSRTRTRTQAAMLLVQGALSVLLLIGAGLFVGSLDAAQSVDLGLDTDRLMIISAVRGDTPVGTDFRDRLRRRVEAIPGVQRTTRAAGTVPFVSSWAVRLKVQGLDDRPKVEDGGPYLAAVEPGYFDVVGTRIIEGRAFTTEDRAGAPRVAIVNRTMARLFWTGQSALGKCLHIGPNEPPCSTVVGVVENTRRQEIVEGESLLYYVPLDQAAADLRDSPRLLARLASGDGETHARVAEMARREALALEPGLRAVMPRSIEDVISPQLRAWRLGAGLFSVFGVLALIVAAVGLYSVVAFDVEGRRHEMGVRTALGATSGAILKLVVADGLRLAAGGVAVGLAIAWLLAPQVAGLLYEIPPHDVRVFSGVAVVLIAAALLASVIPGVRAAHIDPSQALRSE